MTYLSRMGDDSDEFYFLIFLFSKLSLPFTLEMYKTKRFFAKNREQRGSEIVKNRRKELKQVLSAPVSLKNYRTSKHTQQERLASRSFAPSRISRI